MDIQLRATTIEPLPIGETPTKLVQGVDFSKLIMSSTEQPTMRILLTAEALTAYEYGVKAISEDRFDEAVLLFQATCRDAPNYFPANYNLAAALALSGKKSDAIVVMTRALEIYPREARGWFLLSWIYETTDMTPQAAMCAEAACRLEPNDPRYRWDRCQYLLSMGDFESGWVGAEARLASGRDKNKNHFMRPPHIPYYQGEDLSEKTLLVYSEQGIGEQMMTATFYKEVAARCKKMIVEVDERLVGIMRRSFPNIEFYSSWLNGNRVEAYSRSDFQLPAFSLGPFVRQSFDDFPDLGVPTLAVNEDLMNKTRQRYVDLAKGRPIIGLSWKSKAWDGHGESKSIPLSEMRRIYENDKAFFVSVQYHQDDLTEEERAVGDAIYHDPEVKYYHDYDQVSAQIAAMDMVVTISNTTIHTAGTLNIPTSAIINSGKARHWYWFLRRHDCPWYPSIRLFRPEPETDGGKWYATSIKRIAAEIREITG